MFNWLLRLLADKLSRHGNKNRINVLNYHRVGESYSAENPEKICWPLFRALRQRRQLAAAEHRIRFGLGWHRKS